MSEPKDGGAVPDPSVPNRSASGHRTSAGALLRKVFEEPMKALKERGLDPNPQDGTSPETAADRTVVVVLGRPRATVAGVSDHLVDLAQLSPAQRGRRYEEIVKLIVQVEMAKTVTITNEERAAIADYLAARPFTMRQLRAAAEVLKSTETYRSVGTDQWARAFMLPTFAQDQIARMLRAEYARGQRDERERLRASPEKQAAEDRTAEDRTGLLLEMTRRALSAEAKLEEEQRRFRRECDEAREKWMDLEARCAELEGRIQQQLLDEEHREESESRQG